MLLAVSLGYFSYKPILTAAANYLVFSQKPEKADAIVILAGDETGLREQYGAVLYKDGYADKIIVSGGVVGWNTTYADIMKKHLVFLGIPEKDIMLEAKSTSTAGNAKFCLPIIKSNGFMSIILVTSSYHSRRAFLIFDKLYKNDKIRVLSCPVPECVDWFKADEWWTRRDDFEIVMQEYFKNLFYFLHE